MAIVAVSPERVTHHAHAPPPYCPSWHSPSTVDTTGPVIAAHADEPAVEATGPSGAVVTYTAPTATDIVDGSVPVTCVLASGSTFYLGISTITCSAADSRGNPAVTTSFTATVGEFRCAAPALALSTLQGSALSIDHT